MTKGSVVVAFGTPNPEPRPDELDTLIQVEAVVEVLRNAGWVVQTQPFVPEQWREWEPFRNSSSIVIVNLVEAVEGKGELASWAASLWESLHIPFTGCGSEALRWSGNKLLARHKLRQAGLPIIPIWGEVPLPTPETPRWIVKSITEHGSLGLSQQSVVSDHDVPSVLFQQQQSLGRSWFAEQYLPGREFNVAIFETRSGPKVLPVAEIVFADWNPKAYRIVDYAAKWDPASEEYARTQRYFLRESDEPRLFGSLQQLALQCWHLFRLRGAARVDFRLDDKGTPRILEVNANPCLSPEAGFAAAAKQAGLGYPECIEELLNAALSIHSSYRWQNRSNRTASRSQSRQSKVQWRTEVRECDEAKIRELVSACANFRAEEVEIACELVREGLQKGAASGYEFLFLEEAGRLLGYSCWGAIPGTFDSFDLYWIAIHPDYQNAGWGTLIWQETLLQVAQKKGRWLYAETSGRQDYQTTRQFYERQDARLVARLEDFYAIGDDKLIYCHPICSELAPEEVQCLS